MALEITHGQGSYLYDQQGKKYLDLIAGISVSSFGHGHPEIVKAIQDQAGKHLHTLVYGEHIQLPQVELAKAISETLPLGLDQIFFVNSGSEAIEAAMKLAKRATGRFEIISCAKAYHGSSHGALSLNGDEYFKRNYRPLLPGIQQVHFGEMDDLEKINRHSAAIIIETVQGEAGVRNAGKTYWQALRKRCTDTGCLLILDEIQAGWGRTGTFWAFEKYGFIPDVVVMAKAMGGGLPLGAIAAPKYLMQCFTENPVLGHISTFGGHPLSCAASLAGMGVLKKEGLISQVAGKERQFLEQLQHPQIREIRSNGLLIAVELGDFQKIKSVIQFCLAQGLITDWFLHCDTALRIAPPLNILEEEISWACTTLCQAFDDLC